MPVITILNGEREGIEVTFDGPEAYIGKDESCAVRIGDPGVSRKHAKLSLQGSQWILDDMGSSNGTYVNFKKRSQNEPTELQDKDIIFIGRTVAKFWLTGPPSSNGGGGGGPVSRDQLRDLLRGTVPIKGLACPSCRTDLERDLSTKVREHEQVEIARRARLHERDQGSVDKLIALSRR
jgi:pSer/pThr/pTyr-binding forkhead associated (FHA) protein